MGKFTEVAPTPEELAQWRRRKGNEGRFWPAVARVQCNDCGRRIWGSGLGLGAHSRACKGPAPKGFQVQGRRGGEWLDVPAAWYGPDYLTMAVDRANTLADLVGDSEFRVVDLARDTVEYQRSVQAPPVPSGLGWPGSMVSGRADYAREPRRYRRCKGTRRDRRQCRGGWGK